MIKITVFACSILVWTICFVVCKSPTKTSAASMQPDSHNSRNSLDWPGAYQGTLPCADCEGIRTALILNKDLTYRIHTKYLGKADTIFESSGGFSWNDQGNTITLKDANNTGQPTSYFVGENTLTMLDMSGNKVTGELADKYILRKDSVSILEKYWKLTELNGKPVGAPTSFNKEPHITFKLDGNRVTGTGRM